MPFFLFIIFTVYTMLPFQLRYAVVLSVITSLSHILVLTLRLTININSEESTPNLANQVKPVAYKYGNMLWEKLYDANVSVCSTGLRLKANMGYFTTNVIIHLKLQWFFICKYFLSLLSSGQIGGIMLFHNVNMESNNAVCSCRNP